MLEGNFPQHFQNLHHHDAGSTLFANDAVATFSKYLGSEEKPVGRLNKWAVEQQKRLEGDETILVVIRPLKSKVREAALTHNWHTHLKSKGQRNCRASRI